MTKPRPPAIIPHTAEAIQAHIVEALAVGQMEVTEQGPHGPFARLETPEEYRAGRAASITHWILNECAGDGPDGAVPIRLLDDITTPMNLEPLDTLS